MRPVPARVGAAWSAVALAACLSRGSDTESGPAPVDTRPPPVVIDTTSAPDTGVATPPITPSDTTAPVDTPPATPQAQRGNQPEKAPQVSQSEYEGWRQYSVNCARCHGQDVLPNPVAANLLVSLAAGGPVDTPEKFAQVVSEGRPDRGMPAFKTVLSSEQIQAVYAYVKGRADKRIPPGRPAEPTR